jgi:hypothetical protein
MLAIQEGNVLTTYEDWDLWTLLPGKSPSPQRALKCGENVQGDGWLNFAQV